MEVETFFSLSSFYYLGLIWLFWRGCYTGNSKVSKHHSQRHKNLDNICYFCRWYCFSCCELIQEILCTAFRITMKIWTLVCTSARATVELQLSHSPRVFPFCIFFPDTRNTQKLSRVCGHLGYLYALKLVLG